MDPLRVQALQGTSCIIIYEICINKTLEVKI